VGCSVPSTFEWPVYCILHDDRARLGVLERISASSSNAPGMSMFWGQIAAQTPHLIQAAGPRTRGGWTAMPPLRLWV